MSLEQFLTHDWWGMKYKYPRYLPTKVKLSWGACSQSPLEFPNRSKQAPTVYGDNLLDDTPLIEFSSFSFPSFFLHFTSHLLSSVSWDHLLDEVLTLHLCL